MRIDDFLGLLPLLIVALLSVVVMGAIAVRRNHLLVFVLTVVGFTLSIIALPFAAGAGPKLVTRLLVLDSFSSFYMGLVFGAGLVTALLSYDYLKKTKQNSEEYYLLLLLATMGAGVLIVSAHFVSFFLGLELLSISLYALIAYRRIRQAMIEAGIKYLILSAVSNAFLLFGMAIVYARLGAMQFFMLAQKMPSLTHDTISLAGVGLILIGFAFKLALAPFHMWAPDVYQGAPAPVTGYVATVSKGAMFALLLRFFMSVSPDGFGPLSVILTVLAVASMLAGNLLALFQQNLKRLLAYSSISHFGYLLVALLSAGPFGVTAVTFYLVAYFVMTLGIFGIIALYSTMDHEAELLSDYRGLFSRNPLIAVISTTMLFSLAGIPLTVGFIAKFYLIVAGVGSSLWLLVAALIMTSTIGLFYYLRAIVIMYVPTDSRGAVRLPAMSRAVVVFLLVLLIFWGIYPASIIRPVERLIVAGPAAVGIAGIGPGPGISNQGIPPQSWKGSTP